MLSSIVRTLQASTLFERIASFISSLCQTLGHGCTRATPRADLLIVNLFYRRLLRTLARFKRYLEAPDPAALKPRPRTRRQPDPEAPKPEPRPTRPDDPNHARSTPSQFGWLRRIIPDHIPIYGGAGAAAATGALLQLLQDPELEALLKLCPTLARNLRPICHALGIRRLHIRPLPFPAPKPRSPAQHPPPRRKTRPPGTSLLIMPPAPEKLAF